MPRPVKTAASLGNAVAEFLPMLPLDNAQREAVEQAIAALPPVRAQLHLDQLSDALCVLAEAVTDMDEMLAGVEVTCDQSVARAFHAAVHQSA